MDKKASERHESECLKRQRAGDRGALPGGFEWYADKPMDMMEGGPEIHAGDSGGAPDAGPPPDGHGHGGGRDSGGSFDTIWVVIGMVVAFAVLGVAGLGLPAWALLGAVAFGIVTYWATHRQRDDE